jgi:hypothetical protein
MVVGVSRSSLVMQRGVHLQFDPYMVVNFAPVVYLGSVSCLC